MLNKLRFLGAAFACVIRSDVQAVLTSPEMPLSPLSVTQSHAARVISTSGSGLLSVRPLSSKSVVSPTCSARHGGRVSIQCMSG